MEGITKLIGGCKGRRFSTIVLDDVGEVEVSDERMKATVEWHKATQILLREEKAMKNYIGTKIIKAEPMDDITFQEKFKGGQGTPLVSRLEGYHVQYPDGYDSWSPKAVFESAYRLISEAEYDLLGENESSGKRKEYFRAESVPNEDPD